MTLGAERNKVIVLVGLVVVAALGLYFNSTGDGPQASAPRVPGADAVPIVTTSAHTGRPAGRPANSEFRPKVGGGRPDDKIDVATIDPELRLDLLAKVQAVPPIEAGRNLFQFGVAPAPDKPLPAVPTGVAKIPVNSGPPAPPPPVVPQAPQPPPVQPINLKYYGYVISKVDGHKRATLLDGEDILVVTENQTVKQRYRIVKIALTSIDIEDIQGKNTQTLKLQDIPG